MAADTPATPGNVESGPGPPPNRRQSRQWQSWIIAAGIAPLCGAVTAMYAARFWSPATRTGIMVSALFAMVVLAARAARPVAALAGGVLTAALYLSTVAQPRGPWTKTALPPLLTLFVLTFAATRFGRRAKQRLGVAESSRGRNAAQVSANLGVAALLGALWLRATAGGGIVFQFRSLSAHAAVSPAKEILLAMIAAALAEATADTVSSEAGEVLGGRPLLITSLRRVSPGTDGAISLAGTTAGVLAAALVVLVAAPSLGLGARGALAALGGGIFGLFFDSLLGATLETRGWLNNDAVNFLSTTGAAACAMALLLL